MDFRERDLILKQVPDCIDSQGTRPYEAQLQDTHHPWQQHG